LLSRICRSPFGFIILINRVDSAIVLEPSDSSMLPNLPLEIRERPAAEIIRYVMDLKKNVAIPLYRSKLMVVGYAEVGKTSLLERLFPFKTNSPITLNGKRPQKVKLELVGKDFRFYLGPHPNSVNLGDGKWKVEVNDEKQELLLQQEGKAVNQFNFTISDFSERQGLFKRLQRLTEDRRTHGIEIHNQEISLKEIPEDCKLEVNVWDFAGQHEYYNNHHHFLSARSIFLVVWKVTESHDTQLGLGGLEFWLKSLKAHLPPTTSAEGNTLTSKPQYSIVIVGTHIDQLKGDPKISRPLREQRLKELFEYQCEMGHLPFDYIEISSKANINMDGLYSHIIESILGHSYMGELFPSSYLRVEELIFKMREEHKTLPMISLAEEFLPRLAREYANTISEEEVKRALQLLHVWGRCVYFETPALLAEYLVLDPAFLTQTIMSAFFDPDHVHLMTNGVLFHGDLRHIWPDYVDKAEFLMSMMEKFEVCFELPADAGQQSNEIAPVISFWERQSVITTYLPEVPPEDFNDSVWPEDCPPNTNQISRTYSFNVIPKELVGRLLVRLHYKMEEKALWRTGLYLESLPAVTGREKVKILIRATIKSNKLEVVVRGADPLVEREILEIILPEIETVTKNYPGVSFRFSESEVRRKGGDQEKKPRRWWEWGSMDEWTTRSVGATDIQLLPFYKDGTAPKDQALRDKLEFALKCVGGNLKDVFEAYSIFNSNSFGMFELHRANLLTRQIMSPSLFVQENWKMMPAPEAREKMVAHHEEYLSNFEWNVDEKVRLSDFPFLDLGESFLFFIA
jgi:GTPase SAR1 family protein